MFAFSRVSMTARFVEASEDLDAARDRHEDGHRKARAEQGVTTERALGVGAASASGRSAPQPSSTKYDPPARDVGVDRADARLGAVGRVDPDALGPAAVDERQDAALDGLEHLEDLAVARAVDGARAQDDDRDLVLRREDDLLGRELAPAVGVTGFS